MNISKYLNNMKIIRGVIDNICKRCLIINVIISFMGAAFVSYKTWVLKEVIDEVSISINKTVIYICVYFALNICIDIFEGVEGYIQTKVSYRINEELNVKINSKISKIRLNIFDDERFYDLLERLNDNIGVGALEFIKSSISISSGLISITIYVVILYSVQWYFPFVFILASIPYYFVALKESKELYSQEKELNKLGRLLSYTENIIFDRNVIKEIHIFQLYEFIVKKANLLRNKIVKKKVRLLYKQGKRKLGINVLKNLSLVGCLAITYINIKYNNGQIGDFMAIYLAIKNLLTEIVSFVSEIKTLNTYDLYLEDLNFFYSYPEEKCLSHKIENKEINFKNVYFKYDDTKDYVLENINISIPFGKKIALVGKNGSGKTTFINLLLGIYDPSLGSITIGNENLINIKEEFYEQISVVLQNYNKYQTSVLENIGLGVKKKCEIQNIVKNKIFNFIEKLPLGINTKLGQLEKDGYELSGGEWQRLALARALVRNKSILIMDEPTASLDPVTESEIYEQFEEFTKGKTAILVTHRLSAAKLCDVICYFEKGRIIEIGSHEELCEKGGKYYNMYKKQEDLYKN